MDLNRLIKYANLILWVVFFASIYKKIGLIGTGMLCTSLIIYYFIYNIFVSNSNIIVAKMISSRIKRGFDDNAKKILSYYLYYVLGISGIMILIFTVLSNFVCKILYKSNFFAPIVACTFVLFLVSGICDAIKAYYNGIGDKIYSFLSDTVKTVCLFISSIFFIDSFVEYGNKVSALKNNSNIAGIYGAIGVLIILIVIQVIIFIVLLCGIGKVFKKDTFSFNEVRTKDGFKSFLKSFLPAHVKKARNALFPLMSYVIISVIAVRSNYNSDTKTINDNIYSVTANLLIPFSILLVVVIRCLKDFSLLHIIQIKNRSKKEDRKSILVAYTAYINSFLVITTPIFITFLCFSKSIYEKLFNVSSDKLVSSAVITSFIFLFATLDIVVSSGLEALSLDNNRFIGSVFAFIVQIIFILVTTKNGLTSSTILVSFLFFYILSFVVHGYFVIRDVGIKYNDFIFKVIKIGIASLPMLIIDFVLSRFLTMNVIILAVSIVIGYLIYYIVLSFVKGVTKKELINYEGTISYYFLNIMSNLLSSK